MVAPRNPHPVALAAAVVAILAAMAVGVFLRLHDPLSSSVVPAEDPYTHMALTREHLRDGSMDPLYEGSTMYPPGLHALLGIIVVFTGQDLYEVTRVGGAVLGAIGVLGMGLLLSRNAGLAAGFVGALTYAILPELVFRSTMMSPTAVDLALVPYLLLCLLEVMRGRLGWLAGAVPLAAYLLFAHPWLFGVLAVAGAAFLLLTLAIGWPARREQGVSPVGFAATFAIIGVGIGLALTGCGGGCGPGFDALLDLPLQTGGAVPALIIAVSLVPLALALFAPRSLAWLTKATGRKHHPWWLNAAFAAVLLGALVMVSRPAFANGLPQQVDFGVMTGRTVLLLAAAAFVLLPFHAKPVSHLAAALAVATYPFVIYNPLDSEFWPHRTVAYLCIALTLLVGTLAGAAANLGSWLVDRAAAWRAKRSPRGDKDPVVRARRVLVAVPALLVALAFGSHVYAQTPDPGYSWYRMYTECEMDGLRDVADQLNAEPDAIIVTGSWQAKLVLAALVDDASRVWYKAGYYYSEDQRAPMLRGQSVKGADTYVLVDKWLRDEHPDADTTFLESQPWQPYKTYCSDNALGNAKLRVWHTGVDGQ